MQAEAEEQVHTSTVKNTCSLLARTGSQWEQEEQVEAPQWKHLQGAVEGPHPSLAPMLHYPSLQLGERAAARHSTFQAARPLADAAAAPQVTQAFLSALYRSWGASMAPFHPPTTELVHMAEDPGLRGAVLSLTLQVAAAALEALASTGTVDPLCCSTYVAWCKHLVQVLN